MLHHVLIIDDEEEVRDGIRLQLRGTRYEILEARDGEHGIELLDDNPLSVDVIICDIRMPNINGIEAIAYFHQNYRLTPVIVLTGYPDVDLAVKLMKQGAVEYLVKPVEKEQLIEAVEKAARQRTIFSGSKTEI
jgi:two-component system chemotaxis response regulator CheY